MFPACALFDTLKQKGYSVKLVTDKRGNVFCNDINNSDKILLNTIRFSIRHLAAVIFKSAGVFFKLFRMWFNNRPTIAIGFGNFCTIVPLITAKIFGAKIILYEQNSIIGKANSFLSYIADLKLAAFVVGDGWQHLASPARKEFLEKKNIPYVCDEKIKILVIGGSQGAKSFNSIIPMAISKLDESLRQKIEITQQVEYENLEPLQEFYQKFGVQSTLLKFVNNVAEIMSDSQLVICRSGASTLTELSVLGRPAILIPYPKAANNHQYHNALYYKNKNAAWLLEEKDNFQETALELSKILRNILKNKELLKSTASNMINTSASNAMDDFVKLINCILKKGG